MSTRAQKEAEGQSSTDQSEGSSMNAKLDQLIGMVTSLTTRVQALETSTTPPVGISTAPASTNSTINTSLLSTTLHQAAKQIDRERTSHCSNGSQFHGYKSFRLRFLAKPYIYTVLASPPAYTRYAEEIEATG